MAGGTPPGSTFVDPHVTFVNEVAKQTGLDPRVVWAWTSAEGAYAPNGTGGFNFLNLRPYPASDVGVVSHSAGGFDQFATLDDAIKSTVARIRQPFLQRWLGPVLSGKKDTPSAQIRAIAVSGWDAGHYTGTYNGKNIVGGALYSDFVSQYGAAALGGPADATALPPAGGGLSKGQVGSGLGLGGLFGGLEKWVTGTAGYAFLWLGLVAFALVLGVLGLLSILGVSPKTVVSRGAAAAVAA